MGHDDEFTKNLEEARKKGIPITDQEGLFKFINDPTKKEENPKNPNDILEEKPNNQNDILEEKTNNQNDMLDENSNNQNDMLDEKPINNPEIKQYFECMQKLQSNLIDYLDDNNNVEEKYELLKSEIDDQKTAEDKYSLTNFLHLLSCIADNHHRESDFFSKLEQIILLIKEGIVSQFSKSEIFKNNKRILLFLFTENILTFDKFIVEEIITDKYAERCYPQYFQLEMKPFLHEIKNNDEWLKQIKKEKQEEFIENREKGENEDEICKIIQKDSIDEFISLVSQTDYRLSSKATSSIYETNLLLTERGASLIEYAAFY